MNGTQLLTSPSALDLDDTMEGSGEDEEGNTGPVVLTVTWQNPKLLPPPTPEDAG